MTYKEAIELIKDIRITLDDEWGINESEDTCLKMAIEALEKQTPKKKHKYNGYRCVCRNLVGKNQRYCESCGQSLLDWSE